MAITDFSYSTPNGESSYARCEYFELYSKKNLTLNKAIVSIVFYENEGAHSEGHHYIWRRQYQVPFLFSDVGDDFIDMPTWLENFLKAHHTNFGGDGDMSGSGGGGH